MGTIANAKVTHYYNCYNGDFIGCLRISLKDYKKRHTLIISIKKERLLFNGVTSLIIAYLKLLLTLCSRIVNLQSISLTKCLFYFCYNTHLSLSIDFQ